MPLDEGEAVSPEAPLLVDDPDVSSDDVPDWLAFGLFSGLASEPAGVGAGEAPEAAAAGSEPEAPVLPASEEPSDALLPEVDEPEVSVGVETAEGLAPERVAPDGKSVLAAGEVSTGPALPEGIALP
ncbi:hypothetical protein GCM10027343_15400 [Noviherbaspirillum agri]